MPAPTALAVFLAGIAGRQTVLRDPSRRRSRRFGGKRWRPLRSATAPRRVRARHSPRCSGPPARMIGRSRDRCARMIRRPAHPLPMRNSPLGTPESRARAARFFDAAASGTACYCGYRVGGQLDPDFATIATKEDRACPNESALDPSQLLPGGDQTTMIPIKHGQTFSGFLRGETATGTLSVGRGGRKAGAAARPNCETERKRGAVMPDGLHAARSLAEFADLIGSGGNIEGGNGAENPATGHERRLRGRKTGINGETPKRALTSVLTALFSFPLSGGAGHPRPRCLVAQWQSR